MTASGGAGLIGTDEVRGLGQAANPGMAVGGRGRGLVDDDDVAPSRFGRRHVGGLIANHHRSGQVHSQLPFRPPEEPGGGLAAIAAVVAGVGTDEKPVEAAAGVLDQGLEPAMNAVHLRGAGQAEPDHRLVGEHDHPATASRDPGDRLQAAGENLQLLPILDVVRPHSVDHAVAIEEDHGPSRGHYWFGRIPALHPGPT